MRRQLSRRFGQFRARWQAFRMRESANPNSFQPPPLMPEQEREAISAACRILDAVPLGNAHRGQRRQTIGTQVRGRDGSASWVKIACISSGQVGWFRAGELTAPSIAGVPKPEILREFEWTDAGVRWHALQFSLAPSPAVLGQSWIAEPLHSIEDRWLGELKQAIDAVNKVPLTR